MLFVIAATRCRRSRSWPSPRSSHPAPRSCSPPCYFGLALAGPRPDPPRSRWTGVRALLRDCVRLPSSWWWLPLAGFGLPVLTWTTGAALGGAQPLTWGLVAFYVGDLIIGALIINIWEEMAWTGYFQRRAASRWGAVGGSLVTSVFFTAIHVPLAFDGVDGAARDRQQPALPRRCRHRRAAADRPRRSLERAEPADRRRPALRPSTPPRHVLDADHFWVRIVVTIAVGIGLAAFGNRRTPQ